MIDRTAGPSVGRPLRLTPLVVALAALACAGGPRPSAEPAAAGVDTAAATITPGEMYERIAALSHDSMMGRATPSPGLESAARYIAGEFAAFGLEPAGDEGTYIQRYPLQHRALDAQTVHFGTVSASGQDNRMLRFGVDFFASPVVPGGAGTDMAHARFRWIGAPDSHGPPELDPSPGALIVTTVPGDYGRSWRNGVATARRAAQRAGATALLVVLGPEFDAELVERLAAGYARPQLTLVDLTEIPAFFVTDAAWVSILEREGIGTADVPDSPAEPVDFERVEAHFAATARVDEDATPPNVVGVLRGNDPSLRDTYVVVSAHMDDIGTGPPDATGDSIYNGADDNASGTAALLEVAEAFAALSDPPRRSVVFLAVSGEERGLLGSRWYSEHPTVPVERIVGNINVDMIARNAPDSIVAIGVGYSSLGPLVQRVAEENPQLGLTVVDDPWPEERFFFRSDHYNFARLEIPALFFFAGIHEDYHQPSDEVEKIDPDKVHRVARLIFRTAHAVADAVEPPRWTEAGLAEIRALTR